VKVSKVRIKNIRLDFGTDQDPALGSFFHFSITEIEIRRFRHEIQIKENFDNFWTSRPSDNERR